MSQEQSSMNIGIEYWIKKKADGNVIVNYHIYCYKITIHGTINYVYRNIIAGK